MAGYSFSSWISWQIRKREEEEADVRNVYDERSSRGATYCLRVELSFTNLHVYMAMKCKRVIIVEQLNK